MLKFFFESGGGVRVLVKNGLLMILKNFNAVKEGQKGELLFGGSGIPFSDLEYVGLRAINFLRKLID
mgnify:CR=1 FL=1